jgi:hypothetical protein
MAMGCSIAKHIERGLIDLAFQTIDRHLAAAYQVADREIADAIRLCSPLNGLLGEPSHDQQLFFQFIETALEPNSCHPNLPVM